MSSPEVSTCYRWQNSKRCNLANGSFESAVCNVPLESTRGLASTISESLWDSQLYIKKKIKKIIYILHHKIQTQISQKSKLKIK